jgi:hypothetical protein
MAFSAAFQCAKCPENGDETKGAACPCWWETVQTDIQSGEIKIWKSCAWQQLPVYLTEVIKASNRPAAAVESMRNQIAQGFTKVADALPRIMIGPHGNA